MQARRIPTDTRRFGGGGDRKGFEEGFKPGRGNLDGLRGGPSLLKSLCDRGGEGAKKQKTRKRVEGKKDCQAAWKNGETGKVITFN